jgi:hypothetical protein
MPRFAIIAALACAACGTLVDAEYAGEPVVRLRGVASGPRLSRETTAGVKGAILWQSLGPSGLVDFTRLPLELEFPAFWIDILSLPHDDAALQLEPGAPTIAEAYLHIVRPDTGGLPRADDFLATDYEHVLVYVAGPCAPGTMTASYLGAPLDRGFHVMVRAPVDPLPAPQQVLVEQCVARAGDTPPDRARAACTALHHYQLAPAPDDLETVLQFHVESPGA